MDRNDALLSDWRAARAGARGRGGQGRDRAGAGHPPDQHGRLRARPCAAAGRCRRGQDDLAARVRAGPGRRLRAHRRHHRPDAQRPDLLHLHQRRGQAGGRARAVDQARRRPGDLLLQRDQPGAPAGAFAAAARDGRAQRCRVQPRVPLPAPAGVRRPQPRRARGDLRDLGGGARPLHAGSDHRRAGDRCRAAQPDVRAALPRHRPARSASWPRRCSTTGS